MPLYFHVVTRILKEMRIKQQQTGGHFDYGTFKRALATEGLTGGQLGPLGQRLETLESFMAQEHVAQGLCLSKKSSRKENVEAFKNTATAWEGKVSTEQHNLSVTSQHGVDILINKTMKTAPGWTIDNCRPLLSLCDGRVCVCSVQHLPEPVPRAEYHDGPGRCPG